MSVKTKNFYENCVNKECSHLLFDLDGNKAFFNNAFSKNSRFYKKHQDEIYFRPEVYFVECEYWAELKIDKKQNSIIDELYKTAKDKNCHAFTSLVNNIILSKFQANEIVEIIELCISLDMISLGFDLAAKAREIYPQHNKIESAYKALSPPKVIGTKSASLQADNMKKTLQWFKENAEKHKGKWVAVNNGQLLVESNSFKELTAKIDEKYMNPNTITEKIF